MGEGLFSKVKNWIRDDEDDYLDVDEREELEDNVEYDDYEEDLVPQFPAVNTSKNNKIVNLHANNQLKVVICEPKKYDEAPNIADHLKQNKAVIVNLEGLDDSETRKSIFNFMSGAVYVLDGTIQRVSKAIFILAPNNVDIDANMKKELESKVFFPWQNK